MGQIIVIDGCDGSGKQTQSEKLEQKLVSLGKKVRRISFPLYNTLTGSLVKKYLGGEFGDINSLPVMVVSNFYAQDRAVSFFSDWKKDYDDPDTVVILDRYITSNVIHQATKISDFACRLDVVYNIFKLENDILGLPKPDKVIFLDVPPEISCSINLDSRDNNKHGSAVDLHENYIFQKQSYDRVKEVLPYYNWVKLECFENGNMKSIDDVSDMIFKEISSIVL